VSERHDDGQDDAGAGPLERKGEHSFRRKRERQLAKDRRTELGEVLKTPAGRAFVWGLLEHAGLWRSSFSTNALVTAFEEGRRNEGLTLLAACQAHYPESYELMAREARSSGKGTV
jgi:hypothetical protein